MNDIAIYFERYNLGNDKFIFKPVSLIMGKYDVEDKTFLTNYGIICNYIEEDNFDSDDYFGCETTIEKLRDHFGENKSEEELLNEYFNLCLDYYYIGYYDIECGSIKIKEVSYDDLYNTSKVESNVLDSYENKVTTKFTFSLEGIKDLRNSKDITEVRGKLDNIINVYNQIMEGAGEDNSLSEVTPSKQLISLKDLRARILSRIVAQDKAVNDITREVMINQTSSNPRNKSHILIIGPTGTGKTEILRSISEILGLPYFEADATSYTKSGYEGKSVYSMLIGLIDAADGDVEKAQNGILVIDEIDKKLSKDDDVSGIPVLQSLYKIMDRGMIELDVGGVDDGDVILFDTSNLTIILSGAFENLYQRKLNEGKNTIGFNTNNIVVPKKEIILTKDDLYKGGVPPEFLGRIGDITSTNFFNVEDLVNLLTKSVISPLLIQKEYFKEVFDIELEYTSDYITEIATEAIKTKTNARELKPLVRKSLKFATDDFLEGRKGKVLKLTKETALDPRKYYVE